MYFHTWELKWAWWLSCITCNACTPNGDHASHGIHALQACHAPTHYDMHERSYIIRRVWIKGINQGMEKNEWKESGKLNNSLIKGASSIGKCLVSRSWSQGFKSRVWYRNISSLQSSIVKLVKSYIFNIIHILIVYSCFFNHTLSLPLLLVSFAHYF